MLLRVVLFLLALYLFVGILKQLFEYKNKPSSKVDKTKKNISYLFDAEDIAFKEIKKNEK